MSTLKSSSENLTLNADGAGNDIKFQSNASEVAEITDGGVISSTGGSTHADNVKAKFGTGNDLEIYHDATNSYIADSSGTGGIRVITSYFNVRNAANNETMIDATESGAVNLYHNDVSKLHTTVNGITIPNGYYIGSATNDEAVQIGTHGNIIVKTADDVDETTVNSRNLGASYGGNNALFLAQMGRAATSTVRLFSAGSNVNSSQDLEFILRGDGEAYADGSWSGGGADYAEYFEWKDGNPSNEDRRGYSVVLDGEKIVKATEGQTPIGVISGRPAVVGDSDIADKWKSKYLKDDYGSAIMETYTVKSWTDADGKGVWYASDEIPEGVTVPDDAVTKTTDNDNNIFTRRKLNPAWNKDTPYIMREDRPEWDTVGLMGKIRILEGQPVDSRWIKMRDVSDTVEEWLIR